MLGAALLLAGDDSYSITNSARFIPSDKLTKTFGTSGTGSARKGSFSAFVKIGNAPPSGNAAYTLWTSGNTGNGGDVTYIAIGTTNMNQNVNYQQVTILHRAGGGSVYQKSATPLIRDPSGWYHILVTWDTTLATPAFKIYINGSEASTAYDNTTSMAQNTSLYLGNSTYSNAISGPAMTLSATGGLDGYLSDVYYVDGQALTPSSFTKTDSNGVLVPIKYAGTYGTNGFKLEFKNSGDLGLDTSGNGNSFTVNGSLVQTVDTPTNNYATFNPLEPSSGWTYSNGNLTLYNSGSGQYATRGTVGVSSGKLQWRVTINNDPGSNRLFMGIATGAVLPASLWGTSGTYGYLNDGTRVVAGASSGTGSASTAGDYIDFKLDMDAGTLDVKKNGSAMGTQITGLSGTFFPCIQKNSGVSSTGGVTVDFGQGFTPDSGFQALCTANLPAASIAKPSDHFNVVLAAGASIKSSSEALYTYFLEWIKDRANSNNHQLIDTVRGTSAVLQSNTSAAETTYSAPSGTSVGWVWNAGGAASSNTAGSITSSVSANTTAGMSVVKAAIPASGVVTFGHGLGATPAMVIGKPSSAAGAGQSWMVWHKSLSSAGQALILNSTGAASAQTWLNNAAPTSTLIAVNGGWAGVAFDETFYVFAEIPGYSKFGSYTGNGSADGPFVYCGFRPKFVMWKCSTTARHWMMLDAARSTYNAADLELQPNLSNSEAADAPLDLTSNGFKIRSSSTYLTTNNTGDTYIFAAFAEYPFGGSNVAPSPAR